MAEEVNVQSAIKKGQVIARFCHPSALPIIQQWIARLKKRWEEVSHRHLIIFYFIGLLILSFFYDHTYFCFNFHFLISKSLSQFLLKVQGHFDFQKTRLEVKASSGIEKN